ncbi:MAG: hypothetical protein JXN59_15110, partial [Anaerolineae bacterium]|nr:hypothetical protein [Anaerolineae bacterium]
MRRLLSLFVALSALLLLAGCEGQTFYQGSLVTGDRHSLSAGEVLTGELLITDGEFVLAEGATLQGSLYILGGRAAIDGAITGNVSLFLGALALGETAVIEGTLNISGGELTQDPAATIRGPVTYGAEGQLDTLPESDRGLFSGVSVFWLVTQGVLVAALGGLLAQFAPRRLARATDAVRQHPVASGAMGLLLFIVGPALLVFMALTVLLIPLTVLGILGGVLLVASGWCVTGAALGDWLAGRIARRLPYSLTTFAGTLIVVVASGLLLVLPLGSLVFFPLAAAGVGA